MLTNPSKVGFLARFEADCLMSWQIFPHPENPTFV